MGLILEMGWPFGQKAGLMIQEGEASQGKDSVGRRDQSWGPSGHGWGSFHKTRTAVPAGSRQWQ